jgi:DNA polymerase I-like protein with 3'-5' exonuclease and polymerase domains
MAKAEYVPPPDPDFEKLAQEGLAAWRRDRPTVIAFDTETTGLTHADRPFCVTVAWIRQPPKMEYIGPGPGPKNVMGSDGVVYPYGKWKGLKESGPAVESAYFELFKYDASEAVREILSGSLTWVGHNLKFDVQKTLLDGLTPAEVIDLAEWHDTEGLAHLDNEHRPKRLKDLAVSVLGYDDVIEVELKSKPGAFKKVSREKYELDEVRRKMGLKQADGYEVLPRAVILPYALKDAEFTIQLYDQLRPRVSRFDDLEGLYSQEMEVSRVLLDMEGRGLAVDVDRVNAKVKEYTKRVLMHEMKIETIVGRPVGKDMKGGEFNPASNPQLRSFFTEAGFERDSYDAENLAQIDHPLAAALLEYRDDAKMLSTYLLPIQNETVDGILHPSFRQHGTVTGRMSSGASEG